MKSIEEYFSKYYVPNNMAISLSGDLDYENTIMLINKYWKDKKSKPIDEIMEFTGLTEEEISKINIQ